MKVDFRMMPPPRRKTLLWRPCPARHYPQRHTDSRSGEKSEPGLLHRDPSTRSDRQYPDRERQGRPSLPGPRASGAKSASRAPSNTDLSRSPYAHSGLQSARVMIMQGRFSFLRRPDRPVRLASLLAHVGAVLGRSVVLVAAEVVNLGISSSPRPRLIRRTNGPWRGPPARNWLAPGGSRRGSGSGF